MAVCAFYRRLMNKGELFVLLGKYPSHWNLFNLWFWNQTTIVSPEEFGWVYHKSCFIKMLSKEKEEEEKNKTPPKDIPLR